MPSETALQAQFMRLCSTPEGRKRATKKCPPIKVAREFVAADKLKGTFRSRAKRRRSK